MIIDNLQLVIPPEDFKVLKTAEAGFDKRMQKQLMDFGNYQDGNIFQNILKINKEISERLKMRLDLRSDAVKVGELGGDAFAELMSEQEKKLEEYIIKFINMNAHNDNLIAEARKALNEEFMQHMQDAQSRIEANLVDMKKLALQEDRKDELHKGEMTKYMQTLH